MNLTILKKILKEEGIYLSKQRGQNFLIDTNIIISLLTKIQLKKTDQVLEIGTGLGSLTKYLLETEANIISYEKDKKVFKAASKYLKNYSNLSLIHQDFLKADFLSHFSDKFRVIANVPYNITSQILIKLWLQQDKIKDIYLLVQKEVGIRFTVNKKGKENSFLSVLLKLDFDIKILKTINPKSFFPVPSVESVYIRFKPKKSTLQTDDRPIFFNFLKLGFSQKRKKLLPKLKKLYPDIEQSFIKLNISTDIRAESLSGETWLNLFNISGIKLNRS